MSTTISPEPTVEPNGAHQQRRNLRARPVGADLAFLNLTRLGGLVVLAIVTCIGLFLGLRALSALKLAGLSFFTTANWAPDAKHFGVAEVLSGTLLIAAVATVVSVPLAISTSLFISEVSPTWAKRTLVSLVDLMAAVPSVVFGLWGKLLLQGHVIGVARFINTWFGWIPLFHVDGAEPTNPLNSLSLYTASTFVAGLVVAMMVMPIQCSVMREAFSQAPIGEREGALALGSSRWGMIQTVVLPFGKGGVIGGTMLGLGRAMGETIAVVLIISPVFRLQPHILQAGTNSVSSLIALNYGDASARGLSALMAAGLTLFTLTMIVNFAASTIVARSRSGAASQ